MYFDLTDLPADDRKRVYFETMSAYRTTIKDRGIFNPTIDVIFEGMFGGRVPLTRAPSFYEGAIQYSENLYIHCGVAGMWIALISTPFKFGLEITYEQLPELTSRVLDYQQHILYLLNKRDNPSLMRFTSLENLPSTKERCVPINNMSYPNASGRVVTFYRTYIMSVEFLNQVLYNHNREYSNLCI